jgi:hypothetical protein
MTQTAAIWDSAGRDLWLNTKLVQSERLGWHFTNSRRDGATPPGRSLVISLKNAWLALDCCSGFSGTNEVFFGALKNLRNCQKDIFSARRIDFARGCYADHRCWVLHMRHFSGWIDRQCSKRRPWFEAFHTAPVGIHVPICLAYQQFAYTLTVRAVVPVFL